MLNSCLNCPYRSLPLFRQSLLSQGTPGVKRNVGVPAVIGALGMEITRARRETQRLERDGGKVLIAERLGAASLRLINSHCVPEPLLGGSGPS